MRFHFRWQREDQPGPRWAELFERTWPAYRRWFLKEGEQARPGLEASLEQLQVFMPQLVPTWEQLCALTGEVEFAARMLAMWSPARFVGGCSQAIWLEGEPFLIRNYDYHPHAIESLFLHSSWRGAPVLVSSDCLWGALDGMNAAGLSGALSFGGRRETGPGFGMPLILRHVLETCDNTPEAIEVLKRIPSHMAYNITLLDREARHAVVELAPDRKTVVHVRQVSTNHQAPPLWPEYQRFSHSQAREEHLHLQLGKPDGDPEQLVAAFLEPPLFAREYSRGSGTLYTVIYRPTLGVVEYLWPGARVVQQLDDFEEQQLVGRYT